MASDEDARAAARRIVEQVLSPGAPAPAASAPTALAEEVVDDVVIELTDEFDVADPIAVVEDVAEDLAEAADVDVDDVDVSEPRARARALVAEVLAAHTRRAEEQGAAGGSTAHDRSVAAHAERGDEPGAAPAATPTPAGRAGPPADGPARSRARELVAAALAAAEEREEIARAELEAHAAEERAAAEARAAEERAAAEAAARAEAEAAAEREREREAARRIEEARRAEAERAEAERARREAIERERREEAERLERERERAVAEERERALWADADRDVAAETTPVDTRTRDDRTGDDRTQDDRTQDDRTRDDRTVPMSVAELAATGHPDDPTDDRSADPGGRAAATGTIAVSRQDAGREAEERLTAGEDLGARSPEPRVLEEDPRVLEAVVELDTPLPPARGGRWLLVSVIGAITLAVVFPLAVRALLELVALS